MNLPSINFNTFIKKTSLLTLFFIALPCVVHAHKIKIFATAADNIITGSVYYPGGGKYRNGTVKVYSPDNQLLGQSKTNEKGEFSFKAVLYSDHVFVITTQDGHRSQYTVSADELPSRLPPIKQKRPTDAEKTPGTNNPQSIPIKENLLELATVPPDELKKIITAAVAEQVIPLREQIERYEQKIRLHDILGGLGYIFGIFGLAFYFYSKKKSKTDKQ